jgi:serine/threonine protein kinase
MDIGTVVNGSYKITAQIGKGAMGTVYRAAHVQTGQEVAIKVLARDLTFDSEMLQRFRREGEALRQLRHPNIVGFVDTFQYGEQQIIVLEYVAGGTLHNLIRQGPLSLARARRIALGLCDALTRAHELDIIHRDIKPENILIAEDGTPKLTDFGVARLLSEGTRLTGTGTQMGTPFYMSPEAWQGQHVGAQADIWSLGVVLFEMLAGSVPFEGDTTVSVMNKVLTAPLPDIRSLQPGIPDSMVRIIQRMLSRDKAQRYQTMRQVAVDLEQITSAGLGTPQRVTLPPAVPPPPSRRLTPWLWGLVPIVLLSLCCLVLGAGLLVERKAVMKVASRWLASATPTFTVTPTPTCTFTPTPTNTPTFTPSPTFTYTPLPPATNTPAATPTPALGNAKLTLQDFPAGFEQLTDAEMQQLGLTAEGLEKSMGQSFAQARALNFTGFRYPGTTDMQIVASFLLYPLGPMDKSSFDLTLSDPAFALKAFTSGFANQSAEITSKVLTDLNNIGDKSIGFSIGIKTIASMRIDIVMARRGAAVEFVMLMYVDGVEPMVSVGALARKLDARVANALR